MPRLKLTDASIQRLKVPPGGRVEYFDATLPGFGLRVAGPTTRTPDGRRSWVLFYRIRGEQKRLTIDPPYPVLSLADARKRAGEALALVAAGVDPAVEKARKKLPTKAPDTLATVVEDYLVRGLEKKQRAAAYVRETRRGFDNHVLPRLGSRELSSIARRDVIEMLDGIAEGGTKRRGTKGNMHAAGGPIAANRVLSAVRALFNWAIRRGLVEINPCALVERPGQEAPRDRVLAPEELRELWPRFVALGYPFGSLLQLALITGQRRSEVAGMRWQDIDLEAKTWTLAAADTKAGRGHVVPLSDLAVSILSGLPRKMAALEKGGARPSPYVFTTDGKVPVSGFSRAKERVDAQIAAARKKTRTDPMPAWGIHDLRRTAATQMGQLGTSEFVIGRVLNHAARGITGTVYNRYEYLAEKRQALDGWAEHLQKLVKAAALKDAAE